MGVVTELEIALVVIFAFVYGVFSIMIAIYLWLFLWMIWYMMVFLLNRSFCVLGVVMDVLTVEIMEKME